MTSLYHDIIFGPVHSRRLGLSLGVNLLPTESKLCSFDCIYCECGWNADHPGRRRFNPREEVRLQLGAVLRRMTADGTPPDVITFAGNGEPTLHPDFEAIIDDTLALRDELCPSARVSVLSNATQIHRDDVRRALLRVDNNILKLDSAFDATVRRMNNPAGDYSVARTVELMKRFEGRMILQTTTPPNGRSRHGCGSWRRSARRKSWSTRSTATPRAGRCAKFPARSCNASPHGSKRSASPVP